MVQLRRQVETCLSNKMPSSALRLGLARFAGCFGDLQGAPNPAFRSHSRNIWPLDGKPLPRDAPRGFDRLRERSSGGQTL
jgi:hypothetical protein